ncbi:MAG: O-antigen ligase family protein [Egibacteraceae bacterium]
MRLGLLRSPDPVLSPGAVPTRTRLAALGIAVASGALVGIQPPLGLLAAAASVFLVVLVLRPDWATLAAIALVYSNAAVIAVTVYGFPPYVAVVVLLLLVLPLIHLFLIRKERVRLTPATPWLVGYLIVLIVSTIASIDQVTAFGNLMIFVSEGLCLYVAVVNVVRTEQLLRQIVWLLLIVGAALALVSTYQSVTDTYENDYLGFSQNSEADLAARGDDVTGQKPPPRSGGPLGKTNRFAQILVVLLPLGLVRARDEPSRRLRITAGLLTASIAVGVTLTYSRGAAVAIVIMLVVMTAMGYVRPRQLVLIALGVAVLLTLFPRYLQRLATIEAVEGLISEDARAWEADGAIRGRLTSTLGSLYVYADHPIIGVGPGLYPTYHKAKALEIGFRVLDNRQPHSLIPHIAAESGTLGLICFGAIIFLTLRETNRARRRWAHAQPQLASLVSSLQLAVMAYLATGLFLHLAYERYYWLILALAGAAGSIVRPDRPVAHSE